MSRKTRPCYVVPLYRMRGSDTWRKGASSISMPEWAIRKSTVREVIRELRADINNNASHVRIVKVCDYGRSSEVLVECTARRRALRCKVRPAYRALAAKR